MSAVTRAVRSYANALTEAAEAQNIHAAVAEELRALTALVRENADLRAVFASPAIQVEEKAKVLEAVIERARPLPLVANFLRVLLRNNRLHHLEGIERAFAEELDRRLGVVIADVTTAAPVTDSERALLESRLTTLTEKKVRLNFATDPALIGGVVTRIGSVIYDGSIRTKLDSIRRRMSGDFGF